VDTVVAPSTKLNEISNKPKKPKKPLRHFDQS
jgi:hypothetical protein